MKKCKTFFYGLLLCLPLTFVHAQQVLLEEGFEDHPPNCTDFVDGCFPDWINTHGTANVMVNSTGYLPGPSFNGERHAHIYVTKNNQCLPDNSADRGEGMALNFDFVKGESYKLCFALRGTVSELTWYLTDGLPNLSGAPTFTCIMPNTAVPPVPAGSQAVTPSIIDLDSDFEWQVFETDWFTPNTDYGQLWFRGSNLNSSLNISTTHVFLDDFVIKKKGPCELECPAAITDLNACVEEDNFGSIAFDCEADYNWDIPAGSTALEFTTTSHSAILQASPGVYSVTIVDALGCAAVQHFEVLELCCNTDTLCLPPANTYCDYNPAGVNIIWEEVLGATEYVLEIIFDDADCGCGSGGGTITQTEVVSGTEFNVDGFFIPCFSWTVSAICHDGIKSEPSQRMCFDGSQDCFSLEEVKRRSDASSPDFNDLSTASVYPNPILNEFNFKIELAKTSSLTIDVFDVNGKRLMNLVEEKVNPGIYQRSWTPQQALPDGIYFVRFQTDTQHFSESVVLRNNQ